MLERFRREKEAAATGTAGAEMVGAVAETAPPQDSADDVNAEDSRVKMEKTETSSSQPTTPPPSKTTKELDDAAFNERDHFLRWVGAPMRVVSWGMVGRVPEYEFEHGGSMTRSIFNRKGSLYLTH